MILPRFSWLWSILKQSKRKIMRAGLSKRTFPRFIFAGIVGTGAFAIILHRRGPSDSGFGLLDVMEIVGGVH
ncbi:Protein of unknown function [Pyronema omphalodes CBS 100304]|uniref:Uncharacterized protein n=1 Tax=Pyronema omphalodes (strain CBS 100304) TaxID=1076935 RepID=U4LEQ8_PYROM|nr:Protein of unknown function [Pyronema omphalodes CBS 100304]